jgi:hypothetical protein
MNPGEFFSHSLADDEHLPLANGTNHIVEGTHTCYLPLLTSYRDTLSSQLGYRYAGELSIETTMR